MDNNSSGFLPFMDVLTGLMGIIILINIILFMSLALGGDIRVRIIPKEGSTGWKNKTLEPVMVVCESDAVIVGNRRLVIPRMNKADFEIALSVAVNKQGSNAYLLALIRPDGYKSFRNVRDAALALDIRLGYEPIDTNWKMVN